MKYYNWTEEINLENFGKFLDFINNNQGEEITLYFQTNGGNHNVVTALLDIIEKSVKKIVVTGGIYSGGFYIVYYTKVPIVITKGAMGMWHYAIYSNFSISVKYSRATYTEDIAKVKNNKVYKSECIKLAKKVMTKKELRRFEKDKDVYFDYKRMKEIFPKAQWI